MFFDVWNHANPTLSSKNKVWQGECANMNFITKTFQTSAKSNPKSMNKRDKFNAPIIDATNTEKEKKIYIKREPTCWFETTKVRSWDLCRNRCPPMHEQVQDPPALGGPRNGVKPNQSGETNEGCTEYTLTAFWPWWVRRISIYICIYIEMDLKTYRCIKNISLWLVFLCAPCVNEQGLSCALFRCNLKSESCIL